MTPSFQNEARQRFREAEISPSPVGRRRLLPAAFPRSEHSMMLRSQSASSFGSEQNTSVRSPRRTEHISHRRRISQSTPGRQDQSIPEESPIYSFSGEFMQWSPPPQVPSPNSDQPFLGAPDLSPCSQNRIWTSRYKPTDDQSFEVWRDPFSVFAQLSPRANTPESIREPEEDKENIFATSSDYEFPREQEEEGMNIDFDALHNHRLDAFGAPFAIPFARPLAERSVNDDGSLGHHVHAIHFPVPTETVRPAMRIRFHEEEDGLNGHWDDWGDVLERGQTRDLATLSDQYARGVEQRENNGRQYPMRDDLNI